MVAVFVYGTLKPGEAYYSTFCQPYTLQSRPALAQGCLFHLPQGYPAMTVGDGWVTGALLALQDDQAIAAIDDFEDYHPHLPADQNQYVRQHRPVFSLDHQPLGLAWMYLMTAERVQGFQGISIPTGVWSRAQWPSIAPTTA